MPAAPHRQLLGPRVSVRSSRDVLPKRMGVNAADYLGEAWPEAPDKNPGNQLPVSITATDYAPHLLPIYHPFPLLRWISTVTTRLAKDRFSRSVVNSARDES